MSVIKVIEVLAESSKSWEDATRNAVEKASKSVDNISSVWVKDQSAKVDDGKVTAYRVTLKISFAIK